MKVPTTRTRSTAIPGRPRRSSLRFTSSPRVRASELRRLAEVRSRRGVLLGWLVAGMEVKEIERS